MTEDMETVAELRDVLLRNGFVRCDIAACNCGSWHARYGLIERFEEIKQALSDAGHPLSNSNGNLALGALRELIAQRDALDTALREVAGWDHRGSAVWQAYDEDNGAGAWSRLLDSQT